MQLSLEQAATFSRNHLQLSLEYTIGKRIRTIREGLGFSQEDFASHVNIARSYYGYIERGQHSASISKLIDIALALDVEVGELFPPKTVLKNLKDET